MNLIEQLGGYEQAKEALHQYKRSAWTLEQVKNCFGFEFTIQQLHKAILEYRRANNIFEVGDNVVFDSKYSKDSKVFKVDSDISGKMGIRHATDAEIEAGHRLPTCEVLDEADIPTTAIILEQTDGKQK